MRSKDEGVARELRVSFSLAPGKGRNRKDGFSVSEALLKR